MILLEAFSTLLRDPAHWQFEILVNTLELVVVGGIWQGLIWPRLRRHIHRDINQGVEGEKKGGK